MPTLPKPDTILMPVSFGVPEISDELLSKLGAKIRPVIQQGDKLYFIETIHPRSMNFTWNPTLGDEATGLKEVATIWTLHPLGGLSIFRLSIAQVLAQIPVGYIDRIVAFKSEYGQEQGQSDWAFMARDTATRWGYHLAQTTLYASA